ncbi:hypothetical protein EWM64_g4409 [Hericium alpestre]|uniref:ABC transporter domain-containing protein n=1 Tax=Hericium alpestre TaxID=135208 RepID=A0A4Z0A082_9AGAM|nr:hypothetical protein EWM64_g4409 [Hericium alpestre]
MSNHPASPLYQVHFCFHSGGRRLPFIKQLHSPPETENAPSTFQAHIQSQAEQPGNKVVPFKFAKLDFIDPDVQQPTPLANPWKIGTITLPPPLGPTTMAETVKNAGPHHISMTGTRTIHHDVHVGYRQPGPDFLIANIRYMPEEHLRADGLLEPQPGPDFGIGWYDKKNMLSLANAAADIQRALQHLEHNTPYASHNMWGHAIPHHTQRVAPTPGAMPVPSGLPGRTLNDAGARCNTCNWRIPVEGVRSLSLSVEDARPSGVSTSASLRTLLSLARPEKRTLSLAVVFLLVSSAVSLSIPFTVGRLIDFFTAPNPVIPLNLSLGSASALLLLVFTIGGVANAGRAYLIRMSGERIIARLRQQTFKAALRQEIEYVERNPGEGDVISRLSSDTGVVGNSITQNFSDGLRAVVMSFAGLGAMFYLSPQLTLFMLSVVPPISLGAVFYGRYLKRLSNKTQEALGDMTKVAQESLAALRTIQASNAQPQRLALFSERVLYVLELCRKEAVASAIFFGSTGWSGNLVLLGLLGYGGNLVSKGAISVGDLTSLLMYTVYVGSGLQMITSFFTSLMRGLGASTRLFSLLERRPAVPEDTGVPLDPVRQGPLRFENVYFAYPSRAGVSVLEGFDLQVGVGESVVIVGKSGSGKSSVLSLLLRYYDPNKGKVTFDGQDVRELTVASWRNTIGIVPQDPVMFTGTIASNIAFGSPNATREQIEAAAREANFGRLSMSGGQRQRLAIARALLKKPAILAMDEATSSLDAASERRVNDAIDKILQSRKTTCLFVAHRLSTIARAERIVVLEDGRVTETGTYRQLVQRENSRFRALMAAQLSAMELGAEPTAGTPEPEAEPKEDEPVKDETGVDEPPSRDAARRADSIL